MMNDLVSIGKISKILGVSPQTVRNWESQDLLTSTKTLKGHRRYNISKVNKMLNDMSMTEGEKFVNSLKDHKEIVYLEKRIAKAIDLSLDYVSVARKLGTIDSTTLAPGFRVSSSMTVTMENLSHRGFKLVDRLQQKVRIDVAKEELKLTLEHSRKEYMNVNFAKLPEIFNSFYGETKGTITMHPLVFENQIKDKLDSFLPITESEILKTHLFGQLGKVDILVSDQIPLNQIVFSTLSNKMNISEIKVKLDLTDKELILTAEEYFTPSESILVEFT